MTTSPRTRAPLRRGSLSFRWTGRSDDFLKCDSPVDFAFHRAGFTAEEIASEVGLPLADLFRVITGAEPVPQQVIDFLAPLYGCFTGIILSCHRRYMSIRQQCLSDGKAVCQ